MRNLFFVCGVFLSSLGYGETITFDQDSVGLLPKNWISGVTGDGNFKWTVEKDSSAPSKPNILKQSATGKFPWCVRDNVNITDGSVEAKFKAISGEVDQAGGLIWRWKNGDNYYIARANALENNVSLYYTENGKRNKIMFINVPVPTNTWHTLRVEFKGTHIIASFNGKAYIDLEDSHISGPGSVGLWTKADSVTHFDDFTFDGK